MILTAPGVTCSADSGVFLTEPILLPGLGAFGALLAVLVISTTGI